MANAAAIVRPAIRGITVPRSDLDKSVVAEWLCKPVTGDTLLDSSGYGIDGTLTGGASRTMGSVGPAVRIDAIGEKVDFGTASRSISPTSFSMEVYFSFYSTSGTNNIMFSRAGTGNLGAEIVIDTTTNELWWAHSINWAVNDTGYIVIDNRWTHVVLTYDENTGTLVFVDGTQVDSDGNNGAVTFNAADNWTLGRRSDGGLNLEGADFALARIYDRPITQPEVAALYQEVLGRAQVAQTVWRMAYAAEVAGLAGERGTLRGLLRGLFRGV